LRQLTNQESPKIAFANEERCTEGKGERGGKERNPRRRIARVSFMAPETSKGVGRLKRRRGKTTRLRKHGGKRKAGKERQSEVEKGI